MNFQIVISKRAYLGDSRLRVLAQTLGLINCFSPRMCYHSSLDLHLGERFVQTFLTLNLRRFLASESHAAVQQWKWKVIAIRKIDYKLLTFWPRPAFSLTLRTLAHSNFISDVSEILLPFSFLLKQTTVHFSFLLVRVLSIIQLVEIYNT